MIGVSGASFVAAVNTDPAAPVFGSADLGVVADWRDVARALLARLRTPSGPTLHQLASSPPLQLSVIGTGITIRIRPEQLVIAGFTGRNEAMVADHLRELAAIGVAVPASVPSFWRLDPALLTCDALIEVGGSNTSGEVEPVIIRHDGRLYLGVGSDHTDRDLERASIERSKAVCRKPLSPRVVELPADADWDQIELACTVDGVPYQRGTLAALRQPADLLARLATGSDLVLYCGTLPLLRGEFVAGTSWELTLRMPDRELHHHYQVRLSPDLSESPARQGVA
jgi:4-hydroxyphenylacetate 3-monooxygenase